MRSSRQHRPVKRQRRAVLLTLIASLTLLGVLAGCWYFLNSAPPSTRGSIPAHYAPVQASAGLPQGRVYFVEHHAEGYVLMASDVAGAASQVAPLPNDFGQERTDTIAALALAPGQRYLAIDGQRDHGDTVWIVTTRTAALSAMPADAMGNFLHWLPDGEHFLFRPFLPIGPAVQTWQPGLWIVDAANGSHVNVSLPDGATAMQLVDAAPAPDGRTIILSLSAGLGVGSNVMSMAPDGSAAQTLFHADGIAGLFAWSPDGTQLAYEQIDDSTVPFRPASLWQMTAAGGARQQIALADGGHGYVPQWSPDGAHIAFVARLNADNSDADAQSGRLVSAISIADAHTGLVTQMADPTTTGLPRNVEPTWSSDGKLLFMAMPAAQWNQSGDRAWLWQGALARSTGNTAQSPLPVAQAALSNAGDQFAIVP